MLIGPVVKIDPSMLPRNANIRYLGPRCYDELPHYCRVGTWPYCLQLNESTRYISPTKTPEYLAGGKPLVSTPIRDVVNPYGHNKMVSIASDWQDS